MPGLRGRQRGLVHRSWWLALLPAVLGAGCTPFTKIETPIGTYISTRDSELQDLEILVIHPDGTVTHLKIGGASGEASSVLEAQAVLMRAVSDASFQLGLKAAKTAAGMPP